jgi:hypothetical protein
VKTSGDQRFLCIFSPAAIISLERGLGFSFSSHLNHCTLCCFSGSSNIILFQTEKFQISYMSHLYVKLSLCTRIIYIV